MVGGGGAGGGSSGGGGGAGGVLTGTTPISGPLAVTVTIGTGGLSNVPVQIVMVVKLSSLPYCSFNALSGGGGGSNSPISPNQGGMDGGSGGGSAESII